MNGEVKQSIKPYEGCCRCGTENIPRKEWLNAAFSERLGYPWCSSCIIKSKMKIKIKPNESMVNEAINKFGLLRYSDQVADEINISIVFYD